MTTKTVPFVLVVQEVPPQPDFFPGIDPATATVLQGSVATYACSFTGVAGFTGPVTLAVSGLPEGVLASFDLNPIMLEQTATLTIATVDLAVGQYDLTLEASD